MTSNYAFAIAAFRSRQQVMRFDGALRRANIKSEIISTPRDVAIGCGLSVKFDLADLRTVQDIYRQSRPGNLIGFYQVTPQGNGRPAVTAIPL